jgi:hypothetical protein
MRVAVAAHEPHPSLTHGADASLRSGRKGRKGRKGRDRAERRG